MNRSNRSRSDGVPSGSNPNGRNRSNSRTPKRGFSNTSNRNRRRDGRHKSNEREPYSRKYSIGLKKLQQIFETDANNIIMELLDLKSGFSLLLSEDEEIKFEKMALVWKLLVKASLNYSCKENYVHLLSQVFCSKFIDKMICFIIKYKDISDLLLLMEDMAIIFEYFVLVRPNDASEKIGGLVNTSLMILNSNKDAESNCINSLKDKYIALEKSISEIKNNFKTSQASGSSQISHKKEDYFEGQTPLEDFRNLSIIPTSDDFDLPERPFLRKNIVQGNYQNVEHYLDVQFRLLREDFFSPLRNGILQYQNGVHKKKRLNDVRIYTNAQILYSEITHREESHVVQLNLPKKFSIERSKRLMYGNIVCFSADNFKTLLVGYIHERSPNKLKQGQINVKFDCSIDSKHFHSIFTIAESQAYFLSYRYVLFSLKNITSDTLPMQDYLVHVKKELDIPRYILQKKEFDLGNVFSNHDDELLDDVIPKEINITLPIENWKGSDEFNLDQSQLRAFRGALNNELAIIQGPPGTGKTFIGLKIIKALLDNFRFSSPILVVCYTNHALDQFLEGILQFTRDVMRVGGMSKDENLKPYTVNELLYQAKRTRSFPDSIHNRYLELQQLNRELEREMERLKVLIEECNDIKGIVQFHVLKDIIGEKYGKQLGRSLSPWLLEFYFTSTRETYLDIIDPFNELSIEDQTDYSDIEEYMEMESSERYLENITVDCERKLIQGFYELNINDVKIPTEVSTWKEQQDCQIMQNKLHSFMSGLSVKVDKKFIEENEPFDINLRYLDPEHRWMLYHHWIKKLKNNLMKQSLTLASQYQTKSAALKEMEMQRILFLMKEKKIVGVTTTGAAKYNSLLNDLGSQVVIVEEAAEILEAHIVTSLSPSCKHLILIGDHQQLKPNPTVYELATKYGLNTSLFERMILNGVSYETLQYQHRMRPEISQLMKLPQLYPDLKDSESVLQFPQVKGMIKSLFFIDHKHEESTEYDDNNSHENLHEAKFIICICRHLLLQGYTSDQITILSTYSGQFFLLKKIQREHPICENVRISIVDNYQGEENDIILLSLVRSNPEGNVGFLKISNRICVALSRAKQGMYIIGNMSPLIASSELWKNINDTLLKDNNIGEAIGLQCDTHLEYVNYVKTGEEILEKSPEGGCLKPCLKVLPKCGHVCPRTCHIDNNGHQDYNCKVKCLKSCDEGHPCPLKCFEKCKPCKTIMDRKLPCGHEDKLHCFEDPDIFPCVIKVPKLLPDCNHQVNAKCHLKVSQVKCSENCPIRLDCGHQCRLKCHIKSDPDHEDYRCLEPCAKTYKDCSEDHKCNRKCYEKCNKCIVKVEKKLPCTHKRMLICSEDPKTVSCRDKCKKMLPCGHHCKKKCNEECGDCQVKVDKKADCGHTVKIMCKDEGSRRYCNQKCSKRLDCGHVCQKRCCDPCTSPTDCKQLSVVEKYCPHKHKVKIPCNKVNNISELMAPLFCTAPCEAKLECGHKCSGTCGQCFNGRLHVKCLHPCKRALVCGHICKQPCSSKCPPCQEKCYWKCAHSDCRRKCGDLCVPCKMPCKRKCRHQKCDKLCGDRCSVEPCNEPCNKKLKCGHECIGFCGDPCPPKCLTCDNEELTEVFFGEEDEPDARFVVLEDCNHVIEASGLSGWMKTDLGEITMKRCPKCQDVIYNNERHKDIIFDIYDDVNKIKMKFFDDKIQQEVLFKFEQFLHSSDYVGLKSYMKDYLTTTIKREVSKKTRNHLNNDYLSLIQFQVEVCKLVQQYHNSLKENQYYLKEVEEVIKKVIVDLFKLKVSISNQMKQEIEYEIRRLAILPLCKELETRSNEMGKQISSKIKLLLDDTIRFDLSLEEKIKSLLKEGEKYLGGLGITNQERIDIVKALNFRQGHWYKCPNGHIYCIGDCGGANQSARCPVCKAEIGGTNHRLAAGNQVASEMDGASYAAWSEQANLANYQGL